MEEDKFKSRLRDQFGDSCKQVMNWPRYFSTVRRAELNSHHRWIQSDGRFGRPLTWNNVAVAFNKAGLAAENFSRVTFVACNFEWSDLRCASFAGASLKDVRFHKCEMDGCDFTDARLENVQFDGCVDLQKAKFGGVQIVGREPIFMTSIPR